MLYKKVQCKSRIKAISLTYVIKGGPVISENTKILKGKN